MKRRITFLLTILLLMSGLTWAQTITWTAADQGYENGQLIESVSFDDHVSAEFFQGTNSNNPPKYYNTGAAIRCYGGNYFIVTSDYTLTEITLGFASGEGSNEITTDLGNYADGTWTGSANEVTFTIGGTSGHRRIATFTITYSESGTPNPTITAPNVEIAFDAISGSIEYTINNAVSGGELTASTTADWLSLGMVDTTIPFTCTANATAAPRTAAVTLTYTYNTDQTITKNVTVTQTANPDAVNNISDITATGTYTVQGTIVAKSARGFMVGDGTGYVYYYNANYTPDDYNIGDMVKLSGSVVVYGGVYEFNNTTTITAAETSNYVAEDPTVITGEQMDARVASTTPPQLSCYVQYEGTLSINGTHYNITNISGATTAMGSLSYPLNVDEITALDGKQVKVTGYYVGISTGTYYNTMLGSLEEIASTEPSITLDDYDIEVPAEGGEGYINVTYQNLDPENLGLHVGFYAEDGETMVNYDWITVEIDANYNVHFVVDANQGVARTAYFKVYDDGIEVEDWDILKDGESPWVGVDSYYSNLVTVYQAAYAAPGEWVLTDLTDLTENDIFVIVGTYEDEEHDSYAMSNDNGTSSAPTAVEVTIVDNTLSGEIAENLQWKISGNATDGYSFYPYGNAETWLYCTNTNNGVRVGTNSNNVFTIVDGGVIDEEQQAYYLFNSSTERYIGIYNRSDWRCYTSVNNNIKNQSFAFYKKATSTVTQSTELAQGYNWWSTYIEQEGINGLEMLENSLGDNGLAIRSQASGYTDYYGEDYGWWGSLTSINNESSYRVVASTPCTVTMTGTEAVPSQHPITLNHGWTWMGYVPSTAMDVNIAMAGMEASDGDMLKSQQGYADYYPNYGWYGSLNTIEPGMGLMYYSASGETVTFTYPDNGRGVELKQNLTAEHNHWKPNTFAYPDNMTVMAVVELNEMELKSDNYELAAFTANGECRGSVKLTYAEPINRHVAFLTISGKDAAELSFRLYDTETGMEYYDTEESLDFVANAIVGEANDPYTILFRGTMGKDELAGKVQVYPNPVNCGERFSINVADDVKTPICVEIVNALGVVIETVCTPSEQTIIAPNVAGIYTLRIMVEGKETFARKLVVK